MVVVERWNRSRLWTAVGLGWRLAVVLFVLTVVVCRFGAAVDARQVWELVFLNFNALVIMMWSALGVSSFNVGC